MGGTLFVTLLPGALALLLVWAGIEDARTREIADWKNIAIALLAPLWWHASGMAPWPDMALQIGLAAAVFGLFCGVFAFGWMGGGDVKMIGALALWFPLQALVWMLVVMSIAGGALTIVMLFDRARDRTTPIEVPYGVAIAFAALLAMRELHLNHPSIVA
ncbi:prepilin peptidase [Sphingomonas sp. H39-1-10]|uniref:A24 family peptidase n=1 Tax=Sphingomonas pollutisoli TaxID=3030829 RepID=UPI0023BA0D80|nr:prepilin peptidase [Sphingomonas pollutisoli]MDF0488479.1 prepilin peptidase [Sphingomonas pollutisoli]